MKGDTENPYVGMLAFLTIPGPFFGGLMLVPPRHVAQAAAAKATAASIRRNSLPYLEQPELRKLVYFIGATTVAKS
jgi:hypothetical protein